MYFYKGRASPEKAEYEQTPWTPEYKQTPFGHTSWQISYAAMDQD